MIFQAVVPPTEGTQDGRGRQGMLIDKGRPVMPEITIVFRTTPVIAWLV